MGLNLTPYYVFEDARALNGPDRGKAADRTVVNKEVRHRLPVCAQPKVLGYAQQTVVGRLNDLEMVAPACQEAFCAPAA